MVIAGRPREWLDLEGRDWDLVARALSQALMAGMRIGGAEVAAQAIESGLPVMPNIPVERLDRSD